MKKTSSSLLLLTLSIAATTMQAQAQTATIKKMQPELDELIAAGTPIERVATQPAFKWTEGPVWVSSGFLLFAEIPSNSIRKWQPGGGVTIFMQPSGYQGSTPYGGPEPGSNGMTLDARGHLTVAGHAGRSVWRLENILESKDAQLTSAAPARVTVLADTFRGKRLNSPNDLVYRSDGSLYFTDPPYGLPTQSDSDPAKELPVNGVYRVAGALHHPAGAAPDHSKLQLLVKDLTRPNGIAFSPDEKYLYVNNSAPKKFWMRYPVHPDGSLGAGTLFCDATSDNAPGAPDGMKVDSHGNIYSAGPGGVWIFSPEGKHLGTIQLPEKVGNLAFGDADSKTLYITASSSVWRLRVNAPAAHAPVHRAPQ